MLYSVLVKQKKEYESDLLQSVVMQIKKGLKGIQPADLQFLSIAYEPVWAIGTG